MRRLAFEKSATPKFADKFSVTCGDLSAYGHDMGPAFDFKTFERIVVDA